jgi:Gas vesicle synthesis protein GvpL/GvpF
MAEPAVGLYVYCVLSGDADLPLDRVPGVDAQRPVRALRHEGMTAVVSEVSLDEFGGEPLKRNLNDVRWLERTAREHQGVVDRALAAGAIVPLRLCTVCSDENAVRALLDDQHDLLAAALGRLSGRQEWGVKLIGDPRAVREAARRGVSAPASSGVGASSGHAYVARVRQDRLAREEARRIAREAAEAVHRGLGAHAVAARVLRTPPRELSGEAGALVLNGAYLVDRDRAAEFRALAVELGERQRERGLRLEITGPWAPYSFVAAGSR